MPALMERLNETWLGVWPKPGRDRLSNRVNEAIARNDALSEVLVKVIQFLIFATWGLLYVATPQPLDFDTSSQVPLVIGAYLIFTLILLVQALGGRMRGWMIYLSIFVDMALLTYLIWSFHLQYGQPASFSLKSVEVLNYFVLIALRALRFETRYIIAAGVTAIACWAALVIYVVVSEPDDPMTTRSYVDYLTSNTVLVGAEISKMISMAMVTMVLAIAARRAHSFLVSSVEEGSAAQDLSRFVANDVVAQIRDADIELKAGDGVRREAAILNVDIRGFTRLAAGMSARQAVSMLGSYQHHIVPLVHKHRGAVDKFMGDGIMITFGAAIEDEHYAVHALRCADAILDVIGREGGALADLEINLAITSGPVIFGAVGDGDRLEVTVIGAAVNLSAKLEKHNKDLGTVALCGKELYETALLQGYEPKAERAVAHRTLKTRLPESSEDIDVVVLA